MVRGEIYYFIAHIVCYGAMAFLIALFLRFQRHVLNIKMTDAAAIAAAFMLTACFGALTELSQALPFIDRRPSWNDYECNLVGAVAGIFFFYFLKSTLLRLSMSPLDTRFLSNTSPLSENR